MSQILVLRGPRDWVSGFDVEAFEVTPGHGTDYVDGVRYHLGTLEGVWLPGRDAGFADDLAVEAREDLGGGATLTETRLGRLLEAASTAGCDVLLWYAGFWQDLDVAATKEELMALVDAALREPDGEVCAALRA